MKKIIRLTEQDLVRIVRRVINEEETITPSFVRKETCSACESVGLGYYKLENGAYEVQSFLIHNGHDIPFDGNFGNKTATALATWIYGYKEGIRTPRQLAERMKKDGWDVGTITDTPYGRQMAKEVAKLIQKICNGLSAACNKMTADFEKSINTERKDFYKQRNDFHPNKNSSLYDDKRFCEGFLPKLISQAKQEFTNWINNSKTQQKLNSTSLVGELKKIINGIDKNLYSCAGPYDYKEFFKKEAAALYDPAINKIKVNYENFDPSYLLATLIHETTHYIEGNLSNTTRQTINHPSNVKKVYPNSQNSTWERDFFDNQFFFKLSIKDVPAVSMQQLQSIGISKDIIQSLIDRWNSMFKDIKNVKYACSREEKEANLKSVRKLYTGSLAGELTKENLRDIILMKKGDADEHLFIICWVGSGFNPPPLEFLKYSNDLAVNDNNQDKNTNNTISLDFRDIDPMA